MDLKSLIQRMDQLSERQAGQYFKLTPDEVNKQVGSINDPQQRANALANLARQNGLPGLYDPKDPDGRYVDVQGEDHWTAPKDDDMKLANVGLIPQNAHTSTAWGRFWGSTSKDRDANLQTTSSKYNDDRKTAIARDATIDKVEDLTKQLHAAYEKREAEFQKKKAEFDNQHQQPATQTSNVAQQSTQQQQQQQTNTQQSDQQHHLLPVDPKVQAMQKAILAKDPNALPKYGADGRMGPETQAAMAKHPEIAQQSQHVSPSPTQQQPANKQPLPFTGGAHGIEDYHTYGADESIEFDIAKSLVESFGYSMESENPFAKPVQTATRNGIRNMVSQLGAKGAEEFGAGDVIRIMKGKGYETWRPATGTGEQGERMWTNGKKSIPQSQMEKLKAKSDEFAAKRDTGKVDSTGTEKPASTGQAEGPKVDTAKVTQAVEKNPEAKQAWLTRGKNGLILWCKENPKLAGALGLLGLLGLGGLYGLTGKPDDHQVPSVDTHHDTNHVSPSPTPELKDDPSPEELELAKQLQAALDAMRKYNQDGKDPEINEPDGYAVKELERYKDAVAATNNTPAPAAGSNPSNATADTTKGSNMNQVNKESVSYGEDQLLARIVELSRR